MIWNFYVSRKATIHFPVVQFSVSMYCKSRRLCFSMTSRNLPGWHYGRQCRYLRYICSSRNPNNEHRCLENTVHFVFWQRIAASNYGLCLSSVQVLIWYDDMIWYYDMTWYIWLRYMIWYDIIMLWYMLWYDVTLRDLMWCGVMWYIWFDMIWYDMIWYDTLWYDMIWHDMIWYMIWYDMIWYDTIWYDMLYDIWYMIWYDVIWYDMIWYDMIWYDMIWYDMNTFCEQMCVGFMFVYVCDDMNLRQVKSTLHNPVYHHVWQLAREFSAQVSLEIMKYVTRTK